MRPTIENVKQLEAAQNFRVGPTIERAKRQQAYIDSLQNQFGTLEPYKESLREKTVGALMNLGMPRERAQGFMGNLSADTMLDSVGLIDFTPFALPFIFDEAKRGFAKAEKPIDYIAPTVEAGLGLIEAYPVTKVITKPLRTFLSNLANKTSTPIDEGRRKVVGGIVASPIAVGALSQIPLSTTSQVIPKTFNIFKDLPKFTKILDKDLESILGYDIPLKNFKDKIMKRSGVFSAQSGILMKELSKEIKELFPRTTKKDIEKYLDNLKNVQYLDDSGEFVFRGEKKINTKN